MLKFQTSRGKNASKKHQLIKTRKEWKRKIRGRKGKERMEEEKSEEWMNKGRISTDKKYNGF